MGAETATWTMVGSEFRLDVSEASLPLGSYSNARHTVNIGAERGSYKYVKPIDKGELGNLPALSEHGRMPIHNIRHLLEIEIIRRIWGQENRVGSFRINGYGQREAEEEGLVPYCCLAYSLGPQHADQRTMYGLYNKPMTSDELEAFKEIFQRHLQNFTAGASWSELGRIARSRVLELIIRDLQEYYERAKTAVTSPQIAHPQRNAIPSD